MPLFSFVSALFSTSLTNPWSPFRLQYYINSLHYHFASGSWDNACFFSSTLFPAHSFLLILQAESYTHTCWLTLISGGCGVLRSTRVWRAEVKKTGTRSNRLGPDPADHFKYRPEPIWVLGPLWRTSRWGYVCDIFVLFFSLLILFYLFVNILLVWKCNKIIQKSK